MPVNPYEPPQVENDQPDEAFTLREFLIRAAIAVVVVVVLELILNVVGATFFPYLGTAP